jgi:hypothetical protein
MATLIVPRTLPLGIVDISVSKPRTIDNGHAASSRALSPLDEGAVFAVAGLVFSQGGSGFQITNSGASTTWTAKLRNPPYGLKIEVAVLVSLYGGSSSETLAVKLTTDSDGTGETQTIAHQQSSADTDTQGLILRANLGDGSSSAESLGQTVTLAFTRSAGGTGTHKVVAVSMRLVPQEVITS